MIIPESYEQFPEGTYGYVYQTTHIPSGKKYVGKKVVNAKPPYGKVKVDHQFINKFKKKAIGKPIMVLTNLLKMKLKKEINHILSV
jgi:serine/threonine protein kinase